MAVTTEVGQFVKVSSAVSNTQNISLAAEPMAMIFWWTDNINNDTRAIAQNIGFGFTDFTNERAVNLVAENAAATTDTYRRATAAKTIVLMNGTTGALVSEADVSKSGSTVTVSWSTNSTNVPRINYMALCGTDITNAKVGSVTVTSGTGSFSTTDPALQPDFIMLLGAHTASADLDTSQAAAMLGLGWAASTSEQAALSWVNRDNAALVNLEAYQRTDACFLELTVNGAELKRYELTSFDANGFTLNKAASVVGSEMFYLAIKGGDWTSFAFDKTTATGEQLVTGLGLTPKGAFFGSVMNAGGTTILSEDSGLMFGASDGTNDASIYLADDDGATDSVVRGATSATYALMGSNFSALNAQADVQSFSSGQIDFEWATNGGATDQIIGWAVADNAGGGGTVVKDMMGGMIPFAR